MHSLRSAIGRQDESMEASVSRLGPSKLHNKSKSATIWALDPDEDEPGQEQPAPQSVVEIEAIIRGVYKKDPEFTEMAFYEVVELVQAQSKGSDEMDCLTKLQSTIRQMLQQEQESLRAFLVGFQECLIRKIKKIRRKQKKHELQQFDKIVHTNFKRKGAAFIDEDNPDKGRGLRENEDKLKVARNASRDHQGSSKKNGSGSSNEGKLGKLLSNSKVRDEKKETPSKESESHEESVSFSAVIAQNMTVRQRKTRDPKREKQKEQQKQQKTETKGDEAENEGNDAGFIFFRPKTGKKR